MWPSVFLIYITTPKRGSPSGPYSAAVTHAFGRPNQVTTQPNKIRKNWRPRCRRRGRGRPPEPAVTPPQQYAPLQSLCPPQPRNPSPPRRDSGPRVLPLESTSCTVTGVPPPNTTFKGRAWPAPSSTTSSLHSYEVTTRSPAASTDDLSQDGDSDPSAPCTTATRLASQIAPACENFTIGTRAIFPFPHQDLLGGRGRRTGLTNSSPALASGEVLGRAPG